MKRFRDYPMTYTCRMSMDITYTYQIISNIEKINQEFAGFFIGFLQINKNTYYIQEEFEA